MRNSIFDIVSKSMSIDSEVDRLIYLAEQDSIISCKKYEKDLFSFIDEYCFTDWKGRGHFVNLKDFLRALNYDILKRDATINIDSFFTLIELIYNLFNLASIFLDKYNVFYKPIGNFFHLKNLMDDILQQYNQKIYIDTSCQRVLIIEDKPEVTAVSEIVSEKLSMDVIKYNHRALKGNIELKKQILINLAAEIEPQRKYLKTINDKLEDCIFFVLNNLNIRHNNRQKGDKNYKEYVDKMSNAELEEWYDELYQMLLLAILLIDNKTRSEKIKQLKIDIAGENKNG